MNDGAIKILLFSVTLPPKAAGSPVVVGNLIEQFTPDEMVVAGTCSTELLDRGRRIGRHTVYHVGRDLEWNWRFINIGWKLMVPSMVGQLCEIIEKEHCCAIVAVYPFEEYLLAAYLAARKTGIVFYPYFHNTYLDNKKGMAKLVANWFQPRFFDDAKHVFVMSQGMEEFFRKQYPSIRHKCSSLLHTFNEDISELPSPREPSGVLRFAIIGNINSTNYDACLRLFEVVGSMPDVEIQIYAASSSVDLSGMGLPPDRARVGRAPTRSELLKGLRDADVLLLPHAFGGNISAAEKETIFPTKTIEYLISGRPILAHVPRGTYIERFLRANECALLVDTPDIEELKAAITRLRKDGDLRIRLVRNALRAAKRFEGKRVADHLRATVFGANE